MGVVCEEEERDVGVVCEEEERDGFEESDRMRKEIRGRCGA